MSFYSYSCKKEDEFSISQCAGGTDMDVILWIGADLTVLMQPHQLQELRVVIEKFQKRKEKEVEKNG